MLICHCTLAYDLYYDHCSKCRNYLEYYQLSKTQIDKQIKIVYEIENEDNMTKQEAYNKAKEYFLKYYRKDINELTITNVKGYWLDEITGLTYYYAEHNTKDKHGRFIRPYRVWEALIL